MSYPIELKHLNLGTAGVRRDRKGRVILPEMEDMKQLSFRATLTPGQTAELWREVRRRHFWWRVRTFFFLSALTVVVGVPTVVIPAMILHWGPFR